MVDECTKLICVNGQLVLFNKSQICPYDSSPPNCGLLGFAVLINGDKCCPKWDCPCESYTPTNISASVHIHLFHVVGYFEVYIFGLTFVCRSLFSVSRHKCCYIWWEQHSPLQSSCICGDTTHEWDRHHPGEGVPQLRQHSEIYTVSPPNIFLSF